MESPPPPPYSETFDAPPPDSDFASAAPPPEQEKETLHRTKVVDFLGRMTPIILQNDNGPCPLLAICNILSLKNSLNLSPDYSEISQEKLLSLVAERLLDSNTNIDNKDTGYVENQQQNIADAIEILPRLTTGIDVNIKFRRIDDFEFTRECAIFDLLDIPLYHGWLVDPQDQETADAIGSKSYNTLMGELVSLEAELMESQQKRNPEDDGVDFAAATTAALGMPSPCLSRGQSFDDSPQRGKRGDIEEAEELLRVLKLSEEMSKPLEVGGVGDANVNESENIKKSELVTHLETLEQTVGDKTVKTETLSSKEMNPLDDRQLDLQSPEVVSQEDASSFSKFDTTHEEFRKFGDTIVSSNESIENVQPVSFGQDPLPPPDKFQDKSSSDEHTPSEITAIPEPEEPMNNQRDPSSLLNAVAASDSLSGRMHHTDEPEAFSSSVDGSEPIYEGEECILDPRTVVGDNQEPVYEGEVVLAEQVDRGICDISRKDRLSAKQGELIKNFIQNSANQLTICGLFALQAQVKERELCVFFRNNHFNTMFKYEGELFILVTDQGYISEPDVVWEKLNEVNGNSIHMTGNFKEFKIDDHSKSTWDEQNARATTADYLARMDAAAQSDSSFSSDLELALALQQQELEQQQQEQQPQRNRQQATINSSSGLITGPQVSRSSVKHPSSSKQESSKSKEKCTLM